MYPTYCDWEYEITKKSGKEFGFGRNYKRALASSCYTKVNFNSFQQCVLTNTHAIFVQIDILHIDKVIEIGPNLCIFHKMFTYNYNKVCILTYLSLLVVFWDTLYFFGPIIAQGE